MRSAPVEKPTPVLNDRQRQYLLAAYQLDQQIELQRKRNFARGMVEDARTPAAEWRAMPYGRWQHKLGQPPTPLREALDPKLVSPGTGSTWKALTERGLVRVDNRTIRFPGMLLREQYELPHVSLTRAGRKLARELLGEVRESTKPGVLAASTWRALVKLWQLDPNSPLYWTNLDVGIALDTWERLTRIRPSKVLGRRNDQGVVATPGCRLTTAGRIYYWQHWAANRHAHSDVPAPDPALTPDLIQRVRDLAAEADAALDAPPSTAYQQWQGNLRTHYYATGLEEYQRVRELNQGLPATPAELAARPALRRSWRYFLQEYFLRHHLTPAEWNCWQLWALVRVEKGRSAWKKAADPVAVTYRAADQVLHVYFPHNPTPYELQTALTQLAALAQAHRCGRWLLNFRGLDRNLSAYLRRVLVESLVTTAGQAFLTPSLRVALVATKPALSEWATDLPAFTTGHVAALEWAEFSGEQKANEWLATIP